MGGRSGERRVEGKKGERREGRKVRGKKGGKESKRPSSETLFQAL